MSNDDAAKRTMARVTQSDVVPIQNTPMAEASLDFVFNKVWNSKLSWREKRLISLTCTAISGHQLPLETHVYAALKSGDLSKDDLHDFALHIAAYAGFPVAAGVEMMIQKVAAQLNK